MSRVKAAIGVPLLMFATGLTLLLLFVNSSSGDFINYYFGSYFLQKGLFTASIYEPIDFNLLIGHYFKEPYFGNYTPVPPVTAILLYPFAWLPFYVAKAAFEFLTLLLFCVSLGRLLKQLDAEHIFLWALPIVFLIPLKSNFEQGQLYLLVNSLLIEAYLYNQKKKAVITGALLGFAIALKFFPAIALLYLLSKRNWNTVFMTLVFFIAFSIAPILFLKGDITQEYFTKILPRLMVGEINDPYATAYQSMSVLLKKIFVYDQLLNPSTTLYLPVIYRALNALFSLGVLASIILLTRKTSDSWFSFSVVLLGGVLLSGYGTTYGLLLLMPFAISLCTQQKINACRILILALVCLLPAQWSISIPVAIQFPRLWLLILLLITILYQKKKAMALIPVGFLVILTVTLFFSRQINTTPFKDNYALSSQKDLLLYDYIIKNDSIQLSYYTHEGIRKEKVCFDATNAVSQAALIDNNHIVINHDTIHYNRCRIRKATVFPKLKKVLYLSDEKRGVGFYTLRWLNW